MTVEAFLEKTEQVELNDFMEALEAQFSDSEEENTLIARPEDRISARDWVHAYIRIEKERDITKKEYIPALKEKYIAPCEEKIKKLERNMLFIKEALLAFLKDLEEKNVNFPDLATISVINSKKEPLYPLDEDDLIGRLEQEDSEFLKKKLSLDKKAIRQYVKDKGESPIDDVDVEDTPESVRVAKIKNK